MPDTFITPGTDTDLQEVTPATAGGSANAGRIPRLDGSGRLAAGMMPLDYGGADAEDLVAGETLAARDQVTVAKTGPMAGKVVRAVASAGSTRKSTGHVDAPAAAGETTSFRNSGKITGYTDLVPGADYWLDDAVPGGITATPPTGSGKLRQRVGTAVSPTTLDYEPGPAVRLA